MNDNLNEQPGETSAPKKAIIVAPPLETLTTFEEANLQPDLIDAINKLGWKTPTEIQSHCLPLTIKNRDVAGFAQTGTGKTGVFLITSANKILKQRENEEAPSKGPICVVLTPTRELAMQVEQDAAALFGSLNITSLAVFGGVDYEKQARTIRSGVDVIVATPGRLKDYQKKKILDLSHCSLFVCDEADRMFDMGFIDDVKFFLNKLPEDSQKLLFSATTNDSVKELAFEYLDKPEYISATPESITPENIHQEAIIVSADKKLQVMLGLLKDHAPACSIIFTNTKMTAEWLHYKLSNNGVETDMITGDLPQRQRMNLIKKIKDGQVKALIATDVASRGLHIAGVTHVYNFDLPDDSSNYVHRVGRTARAGASGKAVSLVCEDYGDNLREINNLLGEDLAMEAQWFNPKYQDIVDNAGNPFKDEKSRLGRPQSNNKDRDRRPGGRDRDKGRDRDQKRDHDKSRSRDKSVAGESKKEDGVTRRGKRRGKPDQNRSDTKRQGGQKGRDPQRTQRRPKKSTTRSETPIAAAGHTGTQDPSTGSILKKFIKTIFGRK